VTRQQKWTVSQSISVVPINLMTGTVVLFQQSQILREMKNFVKLIEALARLLLAIAILKAVS
jgi:hypothetical protein